MINHFLLLILTVVPVLAAPPLHAGIEAEERAVKFRVRRIVGEVEGISRRTRSLDELGRSTLRQGREILDIGAPAVYALSACLGNPDWKVRFWIVDILPYLGNPDAGRPLLRAANDPAELPAVRKRAREGIASLRRPDGAGLPCRLAEQGKKEAGR